MPNGCVPTRISTPAASSPTGSVRCFRGHWAGSGAIPRRPSVRLVLATGVASRIVTRALFGVSQLVEAAIDHGQVRGPLQLQASFDEFNLDVRLSYEGVALEFPQTRPSLEEIQDADDGIRRLAGFLIRSNAESITTEQQGGLAVVTFHFDH